MIFVTCHITTATEQKTITVDVPGDNLFRAVEEARLRAATILPYEVQHVEIDPEDKTDTSVTLHFSPAAMQVKVSDSCVDHLEGMNRLWYSIRWTHPDYVSVNLRVIVQRDLDHLEAGYFVRDNRPRFETVRELLEAELDLSLHPYLLTDAMVEKASK